MRRRRGEQVRSVTAAPRGLRADVRSREVRYLISMGIRTACFVAAFFIGGPLRWVCVAAAFILPYFAVVIANAGREPTSTDMSPYVADDRLELPPGSDRDRSEGPDLAGSEGSEGSEWPGGKASRQSDSGRTGTDRDHRVA